MEVYRAVEFITVAMFLFAWVVFWGIATQDGDSGPGGWGEYDWNPTDDSDALHDASRSQMTAFDDSVAKSANGDNTKSRRTTAFRNNELVSR